VTIAVAQNDSAEGHAALLHAAAEAVFQQTPLAVLHVVDHTEREAERLVAAVEAEVGRQLGAAGYADLDWALHTATDEDSRATALVELTEKVGADLLVLGSRRRTPIGKFLLGSTVQRVVLDAPVPVLVVKAPVPTSAAAAPPQE
jgi:nucleotide-binding universal stress UspA family protein